MKDTGVDNRKLVLKHRARGYGMQKNEFIHAQYIDLAQVFSAGSLYSTVEDLLKWDEALYSEKLLPRKSLERMWTPVKNDYGYGWLIIQRFGHKCIIHDGGLPGFVTTVARFPEDKVFIAVLCNLEGSAVGRVSRDIAAIALGQPYDVPVERKETKIDGKALDAVVGEYEIKPELKVTISRRDDDLFAQVTGQGRFQIKPESETKFFARVEEVTFVFSKDDQGKATSLTLHQNGRDLTGKRVSPKEEKKP
jgi:CubicO group peptidase (beta-lactamase class C family)